MGWAVFSVRFHLFLRVRFAYFFFTGCWEPQLSPPGTAARKWMYGGGLLPDMVAPFGRGAHFVRSRCVLP